jgi:hypothetical protein
LAAACSGGTGKLRERALETFRGLLQLALEGVHLFGDVYKLFLGKDSGFRDLMGFAIRFAHGASDADRHSR